MTREEIEKMDKNQFVKKYLSDVCGTCNTCLLANTTILIGKSDVSMCHLIYTVLKEDRKRGE